MSGHGAVLEEVKEVFQDPEPEEGRDIPGCGQCHSGSVRYALLYDDPFGNM